VYTLFIPKSVAHFQTNWKKFPARSLSFRCGLS